MLIQIVRPLREFVERPRADYSTEKFKTVDVLAFIFSVEFVVHDAILILYCYSKIIFKLMHEKRNRTIKNRLNAVHNITSAGNIQPIRIEMPTV